MTLQLGDNQDTFDVLFTLYQGGSVSLETVLDILDVDHDAYDEALGGVYGRVGDELARGVDSEMVDRIIETLGMDSELKCPRCGGTGNIGVISTYRCPEC